MHSLSNFYLPHLRLRRPQTAFFLICGLLCLLLPHCACSPPEAVGAASGKTPGYQAENYLSISTLETTCPAQDAASYTAQPNPYPSLSVPTYVTKVDDTYFIVDCYHNQILYHSNLTDPITDWSVMTDEIEKGHTLASDGRVYLADDTEGNRILIFEKIEGRFIHTQTFDNIGNRPHYCVYDERTDTFYAWSSMTGEMYLFRHEPDDTRMYLTDIRRIASLDGVYVRSFTILDDSIYFVSGNCSILEAGLSDFTVTKEYPVPPEIAGMVQLTRIDGDYYITVSTDASGSQEAATILRTPSLDRLSKGGYEDIYSHFIGGGTPYYITRIEDRYYLTEHRLPGHSIWSFEVRGHAVTDVQPVY